MKRILIFALCAILTAGSTACKGLLGEEDDALESQMELYGMLYYQREYFCSLTDDCASEEDDEALLDAYNDPDAAAADDEDYVDNDGDGRLEIIAVYVDDDNTPDMLIMDSDGDGRYDRILRASNGNTGRGNGKKDNDSDSAVTAQAETDGLVRYGDEVWCGINTIRDRDGDGIITADETIPLMDDYIDGDECNDPDWFCFQDARDYRCDNIKGGVCVVDQNTGRCNYENSSFDEENYAQEDAKAIVDPVLCKMNPIRCK